MQQIYTRTPMCFQVFSCKFAAYFLKTFTKNTFWICECMAITSRNNPTVQVHVHAIEIHSVMIWRGNNYSISS